MEPRVADLLRDLLEAVSRSFYLTLRVLPGPVRPQIGLAYLLARTTDTIADTRLLPSAQRLDALERLRDRIGTGSGPRLDFGGLARLQGSAAERALLERVEEALTVLAAFEPADQQRIREVLSVITSGQELDLARFGEADEKRIVALANEAELDDYTYRVAGCVGEFWTGMCRVHLFPEAEVDEGFLRANGVRFGKGLQLVNVLRDLALDLQQGRCYLPADRLAAAGLAPADLLEPGNAARFRPLYHEYLGQAEAHLAAGWAYTNALPRRQVRVRLACAWPVLIGVKTLEKLRVGNVLDARHRIKVSRAEVRALVLRSLLRYPFPRAWRNQLPGGRPATPA